MVPGIKTMSAGNNNTSVIERNSDDPLFQKYSGSVEQMQDFVTFLYKKCKVGLCKNIFLMAH